MNRALAVAALALVGFPLHAQSIRIGAIAEIARERESRRPLEPHLAVHPGNPNHLLAAAMIGSLVGTLEEQRAAQRCATFLTLDGGGSWSRHDFPMAEMPLFVTDACGPPPTFQRSAFTVDASAGPFRDRLYYACRQAGGGAIVVNSSSDGGETWSKPVAADGGSTPESAHRIPAVAVDARGVLAVAWLERRAKLGDTCQELHFTTSLDGGRTFLPEQRISGARCIDSPINETAFRMMPTNGDYFGMVSTAPGKFRLVWPETREDVTLLLTVSVDVEGNIVTTKQ